MLGWGSRENDEPQNRVEIGRLDNSDGAACLTRFPRAHLAFGLQRLKHLHLSVLLLDVLVHVGPEGIGPERELIHAADHANRDDRDNVLQSAAVRNVAFSSVDEASG